MTTADTTGIATEPFAFPIHTPETAPAEAREALRALAASVGLVPNLAATMASAPGLLRGFLALREIYAAGTFTPADIQVLSITAATENECAWCVAFHTAMALQAGVDRATVDALRARRTPADSRHAALSDFARAMVRGRGKVGEAEKRRFVAAGFTSAQALEVVLGMGFSLLANYAHHLTQAPLDSFLAPHAWSG
jgi:AhpD family alkylhydroperoxidase